jgi:N utilization substance protein A
MEIIVPDDQLSLAIGRRGQNVRLAAQLTGWNIDIFSESKHEETTKRAKNALVLDLGIEESLASIFYSHAFRTTREMAETPLEEFLTLPGINQDRLKEIHQRSIEVMAMPIDKRPSEIFAKEEAIRLEKEREKAAIEAKAQAERAAEEAAREAKEQAEAAAASPPETEAAESEETQEEETQAEANEESAPKDA